MNRRNILQVLAGSGTVALAGCGAVPGVDSASIEGMDPTVENGRAVLSIDYSIDDYATALFEGPDGRVITETRIEPDHSTSSLAIETLEGGEYELILRQDGETVTSETLSVEGADPLISEVDSTWTHNELEDVSIELENAGDVPVYIEQAAFQLDGFDNDFSPSSWVNGYVDAGESRSINIEPAGSVEVEEPGTTVGTVTVGTGVDPISEEFSHELTPASLEFGEVDQNWDGSTLVDITLDVRNVGDVPTTAQVTATVGDEELDTTPTERVDPGETQELVAQNFGTLYEAGSGGSTEVELTVDSPAGSITETVTREIAGADVSIDSMSTTWENSRLVEVTATVSNSGDVEVEAPVEILVGNEVVVERTLRSPGNDTGEVTFYDAASGFDDGYAVTSGGSYDVTVEVDLEEGTASESETKEFDGLDTSFSSINTTFYSAGYDTDDVELSSADFSVQNGGDVVLAYDSVEIEIARTSRTDGLAAVEEISPGSSTTQYVTITDNIVVSPGQTDFTISLLAGGDEVASTTTTVTAE